MEVVAAAAAAVEVIPMLLAAEAGFGNGTGGGEKGIAVLGEMLKHMSQCSASMSRAHFKPLNMKPEIHPIVGCDASLS